MSDFQLEKLGDEATYTSEQLQDLALQTMMNTGIDDEAIGSIEAIALRYDNLNSDILPKFIQLTTDMAAVMGQNVRSAAMRLARALNEPEKALRMLRMVGVDVTDEMTETVKGMVEMGDTAGAQAYVIGLFEEKIGGAAEAMANTFQGKMNLIKNIIGNIQEDVGQPFLEFFSKILSSILTTLGSPAIQKAIKTFTDKLTGLLKIMEFLFTGKRFTRNQLKALPGILRPVITTLQTFIDLVLENWPKVVSGFIAFSDWIVDHKEILQGILVASLVAIGIAIWPVITALGTLIATTVTAMLPFIALAAAVTALMYIWNHDMFGIRTWVTEVWETSLKPALEELWEWLKVTIPEALDTFKKWWVDNLQTPLENVRDFVVDDLLPKLLELSTWARETITEAIETAKQPILDLIGWLTELAAPVAESAATNTANLSEEMEMMGGIIEEHVTPALERLGDTIREDVTKELQNTLTWWQTTGQPGFKGMGDFFTTYVVPPIVTLNDIIGQLHHIAMTLLLGFIDKMFLPGFRQFVGIINEGRDAFSNMFDFITEKLSPGLHAFSAWLSDVFESVLIGIKVVLSGWLTILQSIKRILDNLELPAALTPGSPTPFEIGLRGINKELGTMLGLLSNTKNYADLSLGTMTRGGGSNTSTQDNSRSIEVNVYGNVGEGEILGALKRAEAIA